MNPEFLLFRVSMQGCNGILRRFKLRSAKPFVLPLQIFGNVYGRSVFCQTLIFKAFYERARAVAGRLAMNLLHALCVFLCTPLFEPK